MANAKAIRPRARQVQRPLFADPSGRRTAALAGPAERRASPGRSAPPDRAGSQRRWESRRFFRPSGRFARGQIGPPLRLPPRDDRPSEPSSVRSVVAMPARLGHSQARDDVRHPRRHAPPAAPARSHATRRFAQYAAASCRTSSASRKNTRQGARRAAAIEKLQPGCHACSKRSTSWLGGFGRAPRQNTRGVNFRGSKPKANSTRFRSAPPGSTP